MIIVISILFALIFAFGDYFFIKRVRPLTKKDKYFTYIIKALLLSVICYYMFDLTIIGTVKVSLATWILFDLLIGYLLTGKLLYLGNNSVLDELGDKLDGKKDNYGLVYFLIKCVIFGILITLL
jgi:uncharacterized membrane protein